MKLVNSIAINQTVCARERFYDLPAYPVESPFTDGFGSCRLIKFNRKIELGLPFPRVVVEGILRYRMVMTLPIARTLFSRCQCVVGDRLKETRVFRSFGTSKSGQRSSPDLRVCEKPVPLNRIEESIRFF